MNQNWDRKILFEIQKIRSSRMDKFMLFITMMGNGGLIWIALALILIINPTYRTEGMVTLITLGICAFVINLLVKPLFTRKRPFEQEASVKVLVKRPFGSSFPSGHTATSFACAVALCYMNVPIQFLVLFLATLIGFSRIYLFVHYPSDVLAGLVSGTFIALFVAPIAMRILIK